MTKERESSSSITSQANSIDKQSMRMRKHASTTWDTNSSSRHPSKSSTPDEPPRFTIDLSLSPEQRYTEVCLAFKKEIQNLPPLFDEVVGASKWVHRLAWLLLRGVYDHEENKELLGISRATGVPMYLLVCFNVLLDLFMGCSSGGAVVRNEEQGYGTKMVHFRTLDWGMPSLRRVVVQLDFATETNGPIVASTITYAGYVGALTGVRKGFSMSLNFRPTRNDKYKFWPDVRYYLHLLLVLLGWRRSISSELRHFLLPKRVGDSWKWWRYADVLLKVSGGYGVDIMRSTACYLCFSDGKETTVVEKDLTTAVVRSSTDFIVITNNDVKMGEGGDAEGGHGIEGEAVLSHTGELAEVLHEAVDRRQCAEHNYTNMRVRKSNEAASTGVKEEWKSVLQVDDIVSLVQKYPTTNETTHYACVMDPSKGTVTWCRRWMKPVSAKWIRAHQSDTW